MNGRDLLLNAVKNLSTSRPAWVPFVGVHGARLLGVSAKDYLQSSDLVVRGLRKALELYRPDGLPILFDLQMEAEILGCELRWAEEVPPSVMSHPLEQGRNLSDLPVFSAEAGRFPVALEALRTLKGEAGKDLACYGLICGPFTLALHLMGNNIFLQMFDHPDYVKAVLSFCASVGRKAAQAYLHHGADVVAVVDPMTSQISPEHFAEFVTPHVDQIFEAIRSQGGLSSLFVCGDASRNLDVMGRTRCDNISIDENIPLEKIRDITRSGNKSFGGNLKLTTVLLLGDADDAKLDAIRCIDIGGGCGYVLAPGCDLPWAVPETNLQAVAAMVHDPYQREIAKRTIIAKSASVKDVALPDYSNPAQVHIDVVTLDSSSCAPCQYMVDAVHRAAKQLDHPVLIREHRITTREGLSAMMKLGVKNIPSICIDGQVAFASIIPDLNTLKQHIHQARSAKSS